MGTFSALLALCAGSSPVSGEFPSQRPVTRSLDIFFDLRLNKRLRKQSRRRWFGSPSNSLWHYCNEDNGSKVLLNLEFLDSLHHSWETSLWIRYQRGAKAFWILELHDDIIKWKHFPRYWPFVRGIHRSTVNSPHKGQWRGTIMFSLICVWINGLVNNGEAGDLRRYRAHYDFTVMNLCQHSPGVGVKIKYRTLASYSVSCFLIIVAISAFITVTSDIPRIQNRNA